MTINNFDEGKYNPYARYINKNKKDNKIKPSDIPAKVPNDQKEFHRKLAQDKYDMYHHGTCKNISLDHIIRDANGLPND
ncbi:MAG TPA: hypothetical protein VJ912_01180 [Candidatus Nanoarchaeia archaeon]|nr:hypothetical protein [Candidatus Nanoarchaeia archaeon]